MSQALLIIDIQNDYFPGGAMELVRSPEAGRKAGHVNWPGTGRRITDST